MPTLGSGRYTNYTPLNVESAARYNKRLAIFNNKTDAERGLMGNQDTLVKNAKAALSAGTGDIQMFPTGVNMSFSAAPSLSETRLDRVGDPTNPYVPDLSSPGAIDGKINISPLEMDGNGSINATGDGGVKPHYVIPTTLVGQSSDSLGTQSPHLTSAGIGVSPILTDLIMGKSKGTQGG